jgi:hypothetical protein
LQKTGVGRSQIRIHSFYYVESEIEPFYLSLAYHWVGNVFPLRFPFLFENYEFSRQKVQISNFCSNMFAIFIKRSRFCLYSPVIIRFLMNKEIMIAMAIGSS